MQVRCPHCQNPMELGGDETLADIDCSSCGSIFNLISNEQTATYNYAESKTIGHFELVEQIGRGAFGSVWKGHDAELDRTVAVKIPRKDQLSALESEQFLREARAAAQLKHPNIVSVHEVGRTDETIYIVSDFVEGLTLADWLTGQQMTSREAAELTARLADALQHAHLNGVIHRDLKPANIMLDADGQPHMMDFGLAKREAGEVTMTMEGKVLGTPAYMSPEQAKGEAHDADARSDIYSLGVILFEMLTGEKPFRGNVRMLMHQVMHDEAPSPRKLNTNVPRDLETICLKCLEKERGKRYQSAGELATELGLFLDGRAITSRPVGTLERTWRWCRRNPVVASLLTLTLALLLGISIVSPIIAARQVTLRKTADRNLQAFEGQKRRAEQKVEELDDALGLVSKRELEAQGARKQAERSLALQYMNQGHLLGERGDFAIGSLWLAKALKRLTPDNHELEYPIRTNLGVNLRSMHRLKMMFEFDANVTGVAFSPDGKLIATVTGGYLFHEGHLVVRETESGKALFDPVRIADGCWSVAFSPDGTKVATGSGNYSRGAVNMWDPLSGKHLIGPFQHGAAVRAIQFGLNGEKMATGGRDRHLYIWGLSSAASPLFKIRLQNKITDIDLHPGGHAIAVSTRVGADEGIGKVLYYDIRSGEPFESFEGISPGQEVQAVSFNADGTKVVAAIDRRIHVFDVATGLHVGKPLVQETKIRTAILSPNGHLVVTGDHNGTAIVWDRRSHSQLGQKLHHGGWVHSIAFSPDGKSLLTGAEDGIARRWVLDMAAVPTRVIEVDEQPVAMDVSPDSQLLAVGTRARAVTVYRVDSGEKVCRIPGAIGFGLAFKSSSQFGAGFHNRNVHFQFFDIGTGRQVGKSLTHPPGIVSCAFSNAGTRLVVGTGAEGQLNTGEAAVWDLATRKQLYQAIPHHTPVISVAVSPDSKVFASGSAKGDVRLFELESGKPLQNSRRLKGFVWVKGLQFVQKGRFLVSGSFDGVARLWKVNAQDWSVPADSIDLKSRIAGIAVLADDRTAAIATGSGEVHFWDTVTGERAGAMYLSNETLHSMNVNKSADLLATAHAGDVTLWKVPQAVAEDATAVELEIKRANGVELTESGDRRLLSVTEWKQLGDVPRSQPATN